MKHRYCSLKYFFNKDDSVRRDSKYLMPLTNALALLGTGDKHSYCHLHTLLHCRVVQVIVIVTCKLSYICM